MERIFVARQLKSKLIMMKKESDAEKRGPLSEGLVTHKAFTVHGKIGNYQIPDIVLVLALLALAYQFGEVMFEYLKWTTLAVGYPFPLDYGEGPLLDQILRMAHFENIYRNNFSSPPYTISNYPPFFIMVQVPLYWIFGPALWYGRMISIICAFVTAFFIFLTIFTLTRNWIGSVVGGLLLIAFPYIRQWSIFSRIDELALALSWSALYVTVRYVGKTADRPLQKRGFWLATALFVGSIYTRQTYAMAAPFAAVTWLILGSHERMKSQVGLAIKLGLAVWGISLALFLFINVLTRGGFYLNIVASNINPFYWETVYRHMQEILSSFYPLLILAGLFLLLERWIKKEHSQIWPLAASYLLAASAGSLMIGKTGSSINYLFELCAALSLTVGAAVAWIGRLKWGGKIWVQIIMIAALAFQLSSLTDWNGMDFSGFGNFLTNRVAHKENIERLAQNVKNAPGIVLADEYMGLIPLANKRLYFQPFEFKQLAEAKIVDETSFVGEIRECNFDIVLLYNPDKWPAVLMRWTPAQLAMLRDFYRLDEVVDNVYVLRPVKYK
jgi:TM2 domain-containing membrane protein YozV